MNSEFGILNSECRLPSRESFEFLVLSFELPLPLPVFRGCGLEIRNPKSEIQGRAVGNSEFRIPNSEFKCSGYVYLTDDKILSLVPGVAVGSPNSSRVSPLRTAAWRGRRTTGPRAAFQ